MFTATRLTLRSTRAPAARFLSTSAPRLSGSETTSQHPGKSGIDHLDPQQSTASEEAVHSDKHARDPLAPHQKKGGNKAETAWDNVKKTAEDVADKVKDATGLKN
ncbi:hypothetical protein BCR35DRAFT_303013 [Leucosporidium creatinivorum]|uniref:Uncharacterized protein n=1 Tax=Leucosporidium creatinivorum TaxID=106004 RepID=A0A1Y2FL55_9BASI|nr:hypothetical protein BCR35DRAFT_303013 [Leucosporidium creatinivorum]